MDATNAAFRGINPAKQQSEDSQDLSNLSLDDLLSGLSEAKDTASRALDHIQEISDEIERRAQAGGEQQQPKQGGSGG